MKASTMVSLLLHLYPHAERLGVKVLHFFCAGLNVVGRKSTDGDRNVARLAEWQEEYTGQEVHGIVNLPAVQGIDCLTFALGQHAALGWRDVRLLTIILELAGVFLDGASISSKHAVISITSACHQSHALVS
jgi:hypothetical protein